MTNATLYPELLDQPFDRVLRVRPRLGFFFLLTIPICAGLAALKDIKVAGFGIGLYLLMFVLMGGAVVVLIEKAMNRDRDASVAPFKPWLVWFGFVCLSALWKDGLETRDLQFALQICLPLLVGIVASMFVTNRGQLETLWRMYPATLVMIVVILILQHQNMAGLEQTSTRQTAMTVALISGIFLAEWPGRLTRPMLGWGLCAAVCALTESRMALVVVLALPVLHPVYRKQLRRLGACLLIGAVCVGLLYTPVVQQQLFDDGRGGVSDLLEGDVKATGRFEIWPLILDEAQDHLILGAGVNSSYDFVPTVWFRMTAPHNDYLRIVFEFGLIGLAIFVAVIAWQLGSLTRWIHRSHGSVRSAFTASFLGFLVFLIAACTDNPLGYNIGLGCPIFALMGAAHGVTRHETQSNLHSARAV